jgi:hypothetical protein
VRTTCGGGEAVGGLVGWARVGGGGPGSATRPGRRWGDGKGRLPGLPGRGRPHLHAVARQQLQGALQVGRPVALELEGEAGERQELLRQAKQARPGARTWLEPSAITTSDSGSCDDRNLLAPDPAWAGHRCGASLCCSAAVVPWHAARLCALLPPTSSERHMLGGAAALARRVLRPGAGLDGGLIAYCIIGSSHSRSCRRPHCCHTGRELWVLGRGLPI